MRQKRFDPEYISGAVSGFHAGVEQHGILFVAGQVGYDTTLKVVEGGRAAQTEQALVNLRDILELAGQAPDSIAQLMIFYKHTDELIVADALSEFVEIKRRVLPGSAPVGFVCSVHSLLDPEMLVEVQAVCTTTRS